MIVCFVESERLEGWEKQVMRKEDEAFGAEGLEWLIKSLNTGEEKGTLGETVKLRGNVSSQESSQFRPAPSPVFRGHWALSMPLGSGVPAPLPATMPSTLIPFGL